MPNAGKVIIRQVRRIIYCQLGRHEGTGQRFFRPVYQVRDIELPEIIELAPIELEPLGGLDNTEAVGQHQGDPVAGLVERAPHPARAPHRRNQAADNMNPSVAPADYESSLPTHSDHEELDDDGAVNPHERLAGLLERGIPLFEQMIPLLQQRQRGDIKDHVE